MWVTRVFEVALTFLLALLFGLVIEGTIKLPVKAYVATATRIGRLVVVARAYRPGRVYYRAVLFARA